MFSLSDLNHFRDNPHIRFREETVLGKRVTIVCYMIADSSFWHLPMALETRGPCFDTITGECLSISFPKFFNVGERESTLKLHIKGRVVDCLEKKDGSMVTPLYSNGSIAFKTKKSFFSDVAVRATECSTHIDDLLSFCIHCERSQLTPIFEFTHPEHRIVLSYEDDMHFTLLAIRSRLTGDFLPYADMKRLYDSFLKDERVSIINRYEKTWDQIENDIDTLREFEGYVLVLENGERVKFKTKWYHSVHRLFTDIRERDIADAVIDETVDDIKSLASLNGESIVLIESIEIRVSDEISRIREETLSIVRENYALSFKELAIKMRGHSLFSAIMSEARSNEPNYKELWKKMYRKNYTLRSVFNPLFGVQP